MSSEFWNLNAKAWSDAIRSQGIPSRQATNRAILDKILSLNPTSLLDMGCGEGFLAAPFLEKKISYQGLDASAKLIEMAEQKHGPFFKIVTYEQIVAGSWSSAQKFDLAVFNFSLFDEKIASLLKRTKSFLGSEGSILIQTLHPCFAMSEYKSGWNRENFKGMAVPFSGEMDWYGRTLSDWHLEFREAGLKIRGLQEPRYEERVASIIFELV